MQVPLALEAMHIEHEADRTMSLKIRVAMERAATATGDMLARLQLVMDGLTVNPDRMRANLELSDGLIMAEPIMLALGKEIGRQDAHDVVYESAQAAATGGGRFADILAADARVSARLDAAAIQALLDPTAYIGLTPEMSRRAAKAGRETAVRLKKSIG